MHCLETLAKLESAAQARIQRQWAAYEASRNQQQPPPAPKPASGE